MDKEKDNSNIEEKVTISDLAEKAAAKEPEPKPKKRIGLGIMLTVLALLLVGGALATGYLWGNNNSQSNQGNNGQSTNNNEPNSSTQNQTENSNTSSSENNILSVAEAEKILEKYIGEGNYVQASFLNAFYGTFNSKFDEQQKVFLTYQSINENEKETVICAEQRYEQGECTGKSISYNLMDEKYKSLFGEYGSIDKKNYSLRGFFYLVYDNNINAYREFILPGGGTTSIRAMHKVVAVEKSGNDVIATLTFATINTSVEEPSGKSTVVREPGSNPVTMINLPNSMTDEIVDSMAIYELTLSPYNDSYVLTAVEKVQ